jgi:hypothetical protein
MGRIPHHKLEGAEMKRIKRLETGWRDGDFEDKVNRLLADEEAAGWYYYDIKISSNDNNCLIVLDNEKRVQK